MSTASHCAQCGTELPAGVLGKRCPRCLLGVGLEIVRPGGSAAPEANPTTGNLPSFERVRRFGDYELLEEIARGGMGIVYKARQVSLNRLVAVKMILFGDLARGSVIERFRREAESAAKLQHPNIVAVHEVGEHEGQPYFSMDYVAGPNLAEFVGSRPLPTKRAVRYARLVAEAIAYAHGQGLLHRDLKPSNVLIDRQDQPQVTDFGLAKTLGTESVFAPQTSSLTLSGQVLGSPNYLPPEQAAGRRGAVGPASDVYGLGAILYFLLTARPPFVGETLETTLAQVLQQEPVSPRLLNGSVPRDLETICLKCLEKEPSRRYPGAQSVADELRRFERGEPILARSVGAVGKVWRWCRRQPVVAVLSLGLLLALVFGLVGTTWQWRHSERERQLQRRYAYASDMRNVQEALHQNNRGSARALLRRHLPKPGDEDLRSVEWRYLWQGSQGDELRSLGHTGEWIQDVALSPDGRWLATTLVDTIRVWDTASGRVQAEFPRGGTVSPKRSVGFSMDGKWLVTQGPAGQLGPGATPQPGDRPPGIEIRETTGWAVVTNLAPTTDATPLVVSADGRIAVTCGTNVLQAWNLARGTCRELANAGAALYNLAISGDGSRVAYSPAVLLFSQPGPIEVWDLERDDRFTLATNQDSTSLAISPDGNWVASGHYSGELCFYRLATREVIGPFSAHRGMVHGLAFSPDGTTLATGGSDQLIHLYQTGTTNRLRTLRGHESEVYSVVFSRDGKTLVSGSKDGTAKFWSVDSPRASIHTFDLPADTIPVGPFPAEHALLTVDEGQKSTRLWRLPDGELTRVQSWDDADQRGCQELRFFPKNGLATGITADGTVHLWELASGTHRKAIPLGGSGFVPQLVSSDQRWLLGIAPGDGQATLILFDMRNSQRVATFAFRYVITYAAAFSPDNRWLAFSSIDRGETINVWDLATSRLQRTLTSFKPGQTFAALAMAYSPDGRLLACGGYSGEIRLWSVSSGRAIDPPLKGHISGVNCLAFSADGKTLASSGADLNVRLWNVATRQEILLLQDAAMASGRGGLLSDSPYVSQAGLIIEDRWMLWRELPSRIRVIELQSLAEIDATAHGQAVSR
jgi:eukaryotic-like serine/threonine-protein kinase